MKETTAVVEWSPACVETRMCACTVRGDHLGRPQPAILPLRNHLKTRWFPRWFPRWFLDIGGWFPGKRWVVRWDSWVVRLRWFSSMCSQKVALGPTSTLPCPPPPLKLPLHVVF